MQEFDNNIIAYACWAPSYDVGNIIKLWNYKVKIKKIIDMGDNGIEYEIEILDLKYNIRNIIAYEEQILEEDINLKQYIEKLINEKKFEVEFTKKILTNILKI